MAKNLGRWTAGGTVAKQDGEVDPDSMARPLVLLKPRDSIPCRDLKRAADAPVDKLGAQLDHGIPDRLGAMRLDHQHMPRPQLMVEAQAKAVDPMLALLLRRLQPPGSAAHTLQRLLNLGQGSADIMPGLDLVFRSDQNSPQAERG